MLTRHLTDLPMMLDVQVRADLGLLKARVLPNVHSQSQLFLRATYHACFDPAKQNASSQASNSHHRGSGKILVTFHFEANTNSPLIKRTALASNSYRNIYHLNHFAAAFLLCRRTVLPRWRRRPVQSPQHLQATQNQTN
jgi:hypothetical protein